MTERLVKLTFKMTGEEHFFGSCSATCDRFGNRNIGAVPDTVWNAVRLSSGKFENDRVPIEKVSVTRKKDEK